MTKQLRIVLAQLNFTVGDIEANFEKHCEAAKRARDELKADVIVFPELSLTGYPPEDLLLRNDFIQTTLKALNKLVKEIPGIYCLVSHPNSLDKKLTNACTLFYNGKIIAQYAKKHLPNYGVFDECRYFTSVNEPVVVPIKGIPTALLICEDLWQHTPAVLASENGARIILSPNASPFETDKHKRRLSILKKRSTENNIPIVYVNTVGGQDEIIFDGDSMVVDSKGSVCQNAGLFKEALLPVDFEFTENDCIIHKNKFTQPSTIEQIYSALVLGVRDYVNKNHIKGVLIGVSGGIDSALTLAIACDALTNKRVKGIIMPSRFTSRESLVDAKAVVDAMNVQYEEISIEPAFASFLTTLEPSFIGRKSDVTEENIQARCRAVILMALSNKYGDLVLTTGNRSEIAVGYCTLYGDMAGGYAVLKDIPKTLVYELANYRNNISPVIPEHTITRAPTAELAFDQKDEDSLPPYPILDKILEQYLNLGKSVDEIVRLGFEPDTVKKVINLIRRNEYKRRQSAIGPRINHKSFGKDWRYPITNGFKG